MIVLPAHGPMTRPSRPNPCHSRATPDDKKSGPNRISLTSRKLNKVIARPWKIILFGRTLSVITFTLQPRIVAQEFQHLLWNFLANNLLAENDFYVVIFSIFSSFFLS